VILGWAWRIPFLFSAVLFLIAVYIRKHLDETPEYVAVMERARTRQREQKVPIGEVLRNSPREVFFGFLSITGHNANAYILNAFSLSYMVNTLHMSSSDGLIALTISAVCGIVGSFVLGHLADKIGSAKVFIGAVVVVMIMAYPLFWLFETKDLVWATVGMSICFGLGFGGTSGGQGAFLANLFPTRYRFSGIALSRELNGMLIAGPTPFIASALVALSDGRPTLVAAYLIVCCALTVIAVLAIRKRAVHV
jgi:MFS family permease